MKFTFYFLITPDSIKKYHDTLIVRQKHLMGKYAKQKPIIVVLKIRMEMGHKFHDVNVISICHNLEIFGWNIYAFLWLLKKGGDHLNKRRIHSLVMIYFVIVLW